MKNLIVVCAKFYAAAAIWSLSALLINSCANAPKNKDIQQDPGAVPTYGYEIVNTWPHDATAFTQGLVFRDDILYESTGLYGLSSLRIVDLTTGRIKKKVDLSTRFFGEGITVLNGKIFQLTWRNHKGLIYEQDSLKPLGEFSYKGEGWGLTDNGSFLIMSDGTNTLRFLNPESFQTHRTIKVYENGMPLTNLNELEYIHGEIYANILYSDRIVRIDPESGKILGWIDLAGLLPSKILQNKNAVLNGIAYDEARDRIFVTGKLWPELFEIRVKR
jgi:glutaminyl-peptide cyclotransferase